MKGATMTRGQLESRLQEQNETLLREALAAAPDNESRAMIRSQAALMSAFDVVQVTLIGLLEAGRGDGFIGRVLGGFAGNVLGALLLNADEPETAASAFFEALSRTASRGEDRIGFEIDVDRCEGVPS